MKKSLPITIYVYAYFSIYASPEEAPTHVARMYETSDSNYVLVTTYTRELEFEVPENVADYTPARLAALAARITKIQLTAAEDTKEVNDQMQKLLSIEYTPA
jgi:Tfp pilus assembly protein PilZ